MPPLDKKQFLSNHQNYCNFEIFQKFCNSKVALLSGQGYRRALSPPCYKPLSQQAFRSPCQGAWSPLQRMLALSFDNSNLNPQYMDFKKRFVKIYLINIYCVPFL